MEKFGQKTEKKTRLKIIWKFTVFKSAKIAVKEKPPQLFLQLYFHIENVARFARLAHFVIVSLFKTCWDTLYVTTNQYFGSCKTYFNGGDFNARYLKNNFWGFS